MGTSQLRHADGARLMGPVKSALRVAQDHLDILLYDGPAAYADRLEAEASHPGRSDEAMHVLDAIAHTIRQEVA